MYRLRIRNIRTGETARIITTQDDQTTILRDSGKRETIYNNDLKAEWRVLDGTPRW